MKMLVTFGQFAILQQKMACFFGQSAKWTLRLTKKNIISCQHALIFITQAPNVRVSTCKMSSFTKKNIFGQLVFFIRSTHNSDNRDATIQMTNIMKTV